MNANGGHFQFQLKPSVGGGQIDEHWNNLVLGMIGATIEPANMITGVRLVDKLSGPRAANVIRLEVWFSNYDDTQAQDPAPYIHFASRGAVLCSGTAMRSFWHSGIP